MANSVRWRAQARNGVPVGSRTTASPRIAAAVAGQVGEEDSPGDAVNGEVVDGEVEASRGVGVAEPEGLDEASRLGIQAVLGGVDGLVHPRPAVARCQTAEVEGVEAVAGADVAAGSDRE